MKLEAGMYVRTKEGYICKILKLNEPFENDGYLDHNDIKSASIQEKNITKASYNIIDLVEVGDVVVDKYGRKYEVNLIRIWNGTKEIICNCYNLDDSAITFHNGGIFKVLTHESFENNCYKVGDK